MLKVAIIQLGINDEETKTERIARVENFIEGLNDIDLILLPEIWNIGYFSFNRYREESETLEGETISRLATKARDKKTYIFTGSLVEQRGDKFYNTSVLLDRQGEIRGYYSKMHLFGYGSAEREVLSAGEKLTVVDTEFGKVGLSICYDLRFPELYRRLVDQGATIMLNCAAWPYPRVEHWTLLNQTRAIENQSYFLSCCCAGSSQGNAFIGRSMVVDPWGSILGSATERETVLKTEIFPETVPQIREEFTPLKDRVL